MKQHLSEWQNLPPIIPAAILPTARQEIIRIRWRLIYGATPAIEATAPSTIAKHPAFLEALRGIADATDPVFAAYIASGESYESAASTTLHLAACSTVSRLVAASMLNLFGAADSKTIAPLPASAPTWETTNHEAT